MKTSTIVKFAAFAALVSPLHATRVHAVTIANGASYRLYSTCVGAQTKVLMIRDSSSTNGARAVLMPVKSTEMAQVFKLRLNSATGAYQLIAQHSGKVLDVAENSLASSAPIQQWSSGTQKNQQFLIQRQTDGSYKFKALHSGLYIDLSGASVNDGTPFNQYATNNSCAQRFTLATASTTAPTPTPAPTPKPTPVPTPSPTPVPPPPVTSGALPTDAIFASTSFWYQQIPANAPLHTNSLNMARDIVRQKAQYYGTVAVNTDGYSSPVFIAPANAKTTVVSVTDCQNKGYLDANLQAQWNAVPIPSNAAPSVGTDQEMTIYQPSTDTLWEFWVAEKTSSGAWKACWGGRMQNASKNEGIFPSFYGTTATSLPFLGGQVTAEELRRGEIRHAIGIALVDLAAWNVYSWPAHRSDGNGKGIIAEGQRFRLDPTINVDTLPLSKVGKIVARAAQKYGFVVWDKAGSVSIRVQNTISYTLLGQPNPYPELFEGRPYYQVLEGMPWDRMQFLPMNYGQPK